MLTVPAIHVYYLALPRIQHLLEQQYNGGKPLLQGICKITERLQSTEDLSFLEERWRGD